MVPHTADLIVEAWGPTEVACLEEAVAALAEAFVEPAPGAPRTVVSVDLPPATAEERLVAVLEEVVFVTEVHGVVPVAARLRVAEDGRLTGRFDVVAADDVELVGAVPKAVARHALAFAPDDGTWRARAVIDV
ncbi:MAG: archease [Acidimicrobiales bacterium]